jgi:endonuclease/exonuclease/phosphatase family metal-dependent hydrolase
MSTPSIVSFMTWNAGRLIKKVIKNIQELNNIVKYLIIEADFYCFQEMNPDLNYDACKDKGYDCFKADYNFKNDKPASCIVTLVNLNRFEVIGRLSEPQTVMLAEDPKIPHQKFTRFAMVIAKDKRTGDVFNIVNVHLKGGPAGYNMKKQLTQRLLDFINANAKEGFIILGGDFNIFYKEQTRDYGRQLFIDNGYFEDCDKPTLKRKNKGDTEIPKIPNVKYDYCFYKGVDRSIKLIDCDVITPEKPKPEKFDHYPKKNTFEFESKQVEKEVEKLDEDPVFQELLNVIESTPKPEPEDTESVPDTLISEIGKTFERKEELHEIIEKKYGGAYFLLNYHKNK